MCEWGGGERKVKFDELHLPQSSPPDSVPRRHVPVVKRPADGDVPLVGQGHRREDGATEGDVVEGIDDEGEGVNKYLARPFESSEN